MCNIFGRLRIDAGRRRTLTGADEAPSCTKQAEGFDAASNEFGGVTVVGIRNDKGVKDGFADKYAQQFYVDVARRPRPIRTPSTRRHRAQDDEIRNEIGIPKDLFVLGGRETYVVDKDGTVLMVFNGQLNPEKHVEAAASAVAELPKGGGGFDLASLLPF